MDLLKKLQFNINNITIYVDYKATIYNDINN